MLNIHKLYTKKNKSDEGFTLLEVLIAMLIATFFVIGSMQALVLATALRVKAQENQRANQLIQEDIEVIRFLAEEFPPNNSLCSATGYTGGYAESLWTQVTSNSTPTKQLLDGKGKTYGLSRTLDRDSSNNITSTAKILKINFSVSPLDSSGNPEKDGSGNDIVIATDHIEVIPDAAIEECPN